ncbi:hypothetical protein LCGC14_1918750, partial [marine sediment metagenome]
MTVLAAISALFEWAITRLLIWVRGLVVAVPCYILLLCIILCGIYLSPTAWDRALTSRHIIWCALTLILFVSLYKSVDLSVLNRKIFWFGGLYVGCAFISGFYAVNHGDWIYSSLRALLAVTFLFVAVSVLDEKKLAKAIVL